MQMRCERILWPTDFSELAMQGGRYADALRRLFGAELHVIHVIAPVMTPDFSVMAPANLPVVPAEPEMIDPCRETIQRIINEHFEEPEAVVYDAFPGNPWSGVCDYAERQGINLIVVTTHGRTGLEHALIGSTAERIVQHAPCPVLAVKAGGQGFLAE